MRCHQDRGSEGFRKLFSRPEGVSLLICSVGVSRSAAPRTGLRPGSWEERSGAFLEPSVVGLNPPSSAPGCAVSDPARAPSATQGCPCIARALRGHGTAPSYPPNILRHQGHDSILFSLSSVTESSVSLRWLFVVIAGCPC